METQALNLPTMYGDHHTLEVRRILLNMPGVQKVFASSCFQMVEVSYDPSILSIEAIRTALAEAGYGETLPVAEEHTPDTNVQSERNRILRHTAAYAQTGTVIGFAQTIRPPETYLWPCPGLGAVSIAATMDEG